MTASPVRLERRYRRLLWAFPGPYRRRHGAEIVTTLLDLAEAGHGRQSAAQALHLVACGVRQRFRLPAGRPLAVLAALLTALAVAAAGGAAGNRLGWQTAAPMPSGDEMRALATAAVGGSPSDVDLYPWQTAANGPVLGAGVTVAPAYSADRVRDALAAAGWRTTTFEESTERAIVRFNEHPDVDEATGARVIDLTKDAWVPFQVLRFRATKGGLTLSGGGTSMAADARYGVVAETRHNHEVWTGESAAVRPLTVAGFLGGAVAGWLVAAAFAYRLRRGGRSRRRVASALVATAFAAAVVPAYVLCNDLYRIWSYDTANPNPYIVDGRAEQLPAGLAPGCAVAALVALAAALLIARRGARTESAGPEPVAGG